MIAPLATFIDWSALQAVAMLPSIRECARGDSKLTEAIEFLNDRISFPPKATPPTWNSNRKSISHSRRRDRANLRKQHRSRTPISSRKRLAGIPDHHFVACGCDFLGYRYGFPLKVPAIHRAGFNAATLVAPYHFQRRVLRIEAFDHLRVAEAFAQGSLKFAP